jgi:hypothetical protein
MPARFAAMTAGNTPRIGRNRPSRPSSAIHAAAAIDAGGTDPAAASTAKAMARSNREPTLRTSAGNNASVMRRFGQTAPEFSTAARMRSRASTTAASARPVNVNPGRPADRSASTSTT